MGRPVQEVSARTIALGALTAAGGWMRNSMLLDAICAAGYRRSVACTTVSLLFSGETIERRGAFPRFEYRIAVDTGNSAVRQPVESQAAQAYAAAVPSANDDGAIAFVANPPPASVGLVCGQPPQNPSQGRIEDALYAVLDCALMPRTLSELIEEMPIGWSRTDVVSALSDAVLGEWIRSGKHEGKTCYALIGRPPEPRVDPLVERFKSMRVRERVHAIVASIDDLLHEGLELPHDVQCALVSARANANFATNHIDF